MGRAEPHDSVGRQSHTFTQQVVILATLVVRPRFPGQPKHDTKNVQHKIGVCFLSVGLGQCSATDEKLMLPLGIAYVIMRFV